MHHLIMSLLVQPDLVGELAVDEKEIGCHQHHTGDPPGQPHLQGVRSYGSLSVCGSLHTCSSICSVMSCPPPGNTQDPRTVASQVEKLKGRFGVTAITF